MRCDRIRFAWGAAAIMLYPVSASAQWGGGVELLPGDVSAGDRFGTSAAVWSNRVVAGSPFHQDDTGRQTGAAYAFEFAGGGWGEGVLLLAPDGADGDEFGRSASMCCDTLLVGAPGDDDNGESSGSVYVFTRTGPATWGFVAKLIPDDGAECDRFGWSVSHSAGVAVIGAWSDDANCPGTHAAYIFEEAGGAWVQSAKLLPQSNDGSEQFGYAVATSAGHVLVGAWGNDDSGEDAGALYTYDKIEDVWVVTAIHRADDTSAGDRFGYAVAVSGETGAVGSPGDDDMGDNSGAAYIFTLLNGAWSQSAKLVVGDGAPGDAFGSALDLAGAWALVGAPDAEPFGFYEGAVYAFENAGGSWAERDLMYADGSDSFGVSVAAAGNTAVIGDPLADVGGADSGRAHLFFTCYADYNHDGELNTLDVLAYLNAWAARDESADCDGCGIVDTRDFICFLNNWTGGCP